VQGDTPYTNHIQGVRKEFSPIMIYHSHNEKTWREEDQIKRGCPRALNLDREMETRVHHQEKYWKIRN
jgi:hypothetical protein